MVAQYIYECSGGDSVDHIQLKKVPTLVTVDDFTDKYHLDATSGLPTTHYSRIATLSPIDVSDIDKVIINYQCVSNREAMLIYSTFKGNTLVTRVASGTSGTVIDVSNADKIYLSFYDRSGSLTITKSDMTYVTLSEVKDYISKSDFTDGLGLNAYTGVIDTNATRCASNLITLYPGTYTRTQGEQGYWKACSYNYDTGAWKQGLWDDTNTTNTFTITEKVNVRIGFDRVLSNVSSISLTSTNVVEYEPYKSDINIPLSVKDITWVSQ